MRPIQLFFTIALSFTFSYTLYGQTRQIFVGLEAGTEGMSGKNFDREFVRGYAGTTSSYDYEQVKAITTHVYRTYTGVNVEWLTDNNKIGIVSGLRFSQLSSDISKTSTPAFFYFLLEESGTTTEYLRVKEINQISSHLGLPVQLRYFPFERRQLNFYAKLGADFNFLLNTKSSVVFHDKEMGVYKSDVLAKFGNPDSFYTALYVGVGLQTNKILFFHINVDANFPSFLTSNASSITDIGSGGGIRASIQVPF
jgi:hypothetical protein